MIFNLISLKDVESKIDNYVFDDIGIQTLFDDFYDRNWDDLLSVMEYVAKKEEIIKRQTIFTDILNDDELIFFKIKRMLDEVRDTYKNYLSIDGGLRSYVLFSQYIESLVKYIDESYNLLKDKTFESYELNNLKDFFVSKTNDKEYVNLKKELNNCIDAYKIMQEFIVSYITNDKFIKTDVYKENQRDLLIEIEKYMQDLDISFENEDAKLVRHDLDAYYFNRLEYIYPNQAIILKKFFDSYNSLIKYNYDTLATELNFYLKIKRLFEFSKEKNVNYSKAKISDNKQTEIKGLSDITIINKVEYIQPNDFSYDEYHHMQIVTGANGGGKTTYLRSIGANYIFFSCLGYTFSKEASIYPVKYILTHFPNDENYQVGYGRLQDEIRRIDYVRNCLCSDTLYLLNETFSSTDEDTAFKESKKLFEEIEEKKVSMVFITHQQLLLNWIDKEKVILLNPIVDVDQNNKRTFRIKRVDSEIHAFANDILRKYGLSKDILDKKRGEKNV